MLPDNFDLLILGSGSTGLAVARWAAGHLGERVRSAVVYGGAASAPTPETEALEAAGVRFAFGTEDVAERYDVCVASPGISEFSEFFQSAAAHVAEIMGEPEFAYRLSPERWIAVTGTNGKTTTTSLIDHLLNASGRSSYAVGNIGMAPISAVDARVPDSWFTAELSSYQLATTRYLHPRVAVLLNITPDHLSWHGSLEAYAEAKFRAFANLVPGDVSIICVEDEGAAAAVPRALATGAAVCELAHIDTGAPCAAFCDDDMLVVRLHGEEHRLIPASRLRIAGAHNELNALAAAAAALWVGVDDEDVRQALASFEPLEHRIEPVAEIDGVRYVNDSKATNTDAVEKALTAFPADPVVLLLGGSDKGTPLEPFVDSVLDSSVRAVVCFGAARQRFLDAFLGADGGSEIDVAEAEDLSDAVHVARSLAERGDVVLLSPACSSFDEFDNFEARGRAFKDLVAALGSRADDADR